MRFIGGTPDNPATLDALRFVGDLLGVTFCWFYDGAFHFKLHGDWTVALTLESAGRFRVETCRLTVPAATRWCRTSDRDRLAFLITEAREQLVALHG